MMHDAMRSDVLYARPLAEVRSKVSEVLADVKDHGKTFGLRET
jgi:hypothetical protein